MLDAKVKTLLTMAETRSYTKAAERLHLTQPAVSHHIRQLEESYGIRIFTPDKRPISFTPEGRILYAYARQAYELERRARQAVADSISHLRRLRVGITQTAGESLIPRMIAQFGNDHPDTAINITTDLMSMLYDRLARYELDMVIVEGPGDPHQFDSVLLDTDYLCFIVSPRHPFARHGSVTLNAVKKEKMILRSGKASTRVLFDNFLLSAGHSLDSFHVMMEIDNIATIKELVAMDYGISVMAHSACAADIEAGRMVAVAVEGVRITRDINMVYNRDDMHADILAEMQATYRTLLAEQHEEA